MIMVKKTANTFYKSRKRIVKMHPTNRKAIRERMAEDYYNLHGKGGYDVVGAFWGLSGGMVYRIINDEDYWPKHKKILKVLREKAIQFNL